MNGFSIVHLSIPEESSSCESAQYRFEGIERIRSSWGFRLPCWGLAISVYCDPRFTLDIDLAVAIPGDAQIEAVVHDLSALGFVPSSIVEQESVGRLAIARLIDPDGVSVDLLVASSGIESEVVAAAQPVEVVRGYARGRDLMTDLHQLRSAEN